MTDAELNRAVAEIEGWKFLMSEGGGYAKWSPPGTHPAVNVYSLPDNPPPYATDWQWCGPLLTKLLSTGSWGLEYWHGGEYMMLNYEKETTSKADTPQRAICLAVIAAKEKS